MEIPATYLALTPETLGARLKGVGAICDVIGDDHANWSVSEIGDGNLNLVFIVSSEMGSVIVKQALPYVRLVGESWPLPLYRAFYEHHALVWQAARAPGTVPQVLHFDESQALIIMEFLTPHVILRRKLIAGEKVDALGAFMGTFCADMAFRGSELSMESAAKKADVGIFSGNVAIPAITEALVFTDPYFDAEMNNHTPGLEPVVAELRDDVLLKQKVQQALMGFASNTETMVHGDLHSGSIMATETEIKVIDPEFAQYGPMGFDLGMMIGNFLMAYFSQPAHRDDPSDYQAWLLSVIKDVIVAFDDRFTALWQTERTGMLFPKTLFEDQGHSSAATCAAVLQDIHADAWRFAGIEMHRRCLSLAHNADFEDIADATIRAPLEARNLKMGAALIHTAGDITGIDAVLAMAREFNEGTYL